MSSANGYWYDGKVSGRREITITSSGEGTVRFHGPELDLYAPLKELRIDSSLGTARRMIRLPDGSAVETADHHFLDELQRRQGKGGFFRAVNRWETSVAWALGSLVFLVAVGFAFVRYAVPALATKAAFALPAATEELIGREALQVLDKIVLKPSKLQEKRRTELTAIFSAMKAGRPERSKWRLEFRSGEAVGANAFALPAGVVVMTDSLVALAKSDAELAAVLAHEAGHLNRRHALRHLMQNSATALLIATVTGDITSFTSLSATLPTALIDAKYSRDFEVEADDAAVAYLKKEKIPVQVYADILTRLGEDHQKRFKEKESRFGELLADHPMIKERVKRVMGSAASSSR